MFASLSRTSVWAVAKHFFDLAAIKRNINNVRLCTINSSWNQIVCSCSNIYSFCVIISSTSFENSCGKKVLPTVVGYQNGIVWADIARFQFALFLIIILNSLIIFISVSTVAQICGRPVFCLAWTASLIFGFTYWTCVRSKKSCSLVWVVWGRKNLTTDSSTFWTQHSCSLRADNAF